MLAEAALSPFCQQSKGQKRWSRGTPDSAYLDECPLRKPEYEGEVMHEYVAMNFVPFSKTLAPPKQALRVCGAKSVDQ